LNFSAGKSAFSALIRPAREKTTLGTPELNIRRAAAGSHAGLVKMFRNAARLPKYVVEHDRC
jgi:hypothetical protein